MSMVSPYTDTYRYERKFFISDLSEYEVEALVKLHPAIFCQLYYPRYVNNLYLDSMQLKSYVDSVDGLEDRVKIRIRWYDALLGRIEKPALEIKIKRGLVGKKESFPLVPFMLDENFERQTIADVFRQSALPDQLQLELLSLEMCLLNRYKRKYYQSSDRRCRITIDTEMEFFRVQANGNTFQHKSIDRTSTILELKYGKQDEKYANIFANYFPIRLTKSSKYVTGLKRLFGAET